MQKPADLCGHGASTAIRSHHTRATRQAERALGCGRGRARSVAVRLTSLGVDCKV
jgi:hypothetical protein